MKQMTSQEVREAFLAFFEKKGHQRVASASLVPGNDPTLLFANSGMVQFKDVFLGTEERDYNRATTSQKCLRVSGKHNDLEEVGPSPEHHTFFEMLGNFSFGDYFKKEAMAFAWELLTEVYALPEDRLAVTIYEDDDEAFALWQEVADISPKRIVRLGAKDNFWQMADTGPCGPCSEIHWDRYPERGEDDIIPALQADDDRFSEIWNLVFMQYERQQPDPKNTGEYDKPLPSPSIDTGMGFERILTILQGKEANYETDLFMPIIKTVQSLTGASDDERDSNIVPYRVIADHMRAAVFLISDGVMPGAKGRDSVCRLVIRRAARFGKKLGFNTPFLGEVAQSVIDVMGGHFTELTEKADAIRRTITLEEERFHRTMERGLIELDDMLDNLPGAEHLSGEQAFYLKATLGLPIQVTRDVAEERGYSVDMQDFYAEEERHAKISGAGEALGEIESAEVYREQLDRLRDAGLLLDNGVDYDPYDSSDRQTTLVALLQDGHPVESALVGDKVEAVLAATPFYVEAGGQVSDTGTISGDGWTIEVERMKQPVSGLVVHIGEVVEGNPAAGDSALASVDSTRRQDIMRNHTGTHLLHAALRKHLGKHVQQRGSLVAPERLRFDFSHNERVQSDELEAIEREVNEQILHNYPVYDETKSLQQAKDEGAMALFGEKYGDTVRTVIIDDGDERYSYELCGGTHVDETAEIGAFVFTNEGSVSAGVRRVEALTGREAVRYIQQRMNLLHDVAAHLGTSPDNAIQRIEALQNELGAQKKQVDTLQRRLAKYRFDEMLADMETINGKQALIAELEGIPGETLREMADWFRNAVDENGVLVLGSNVDGKPLLVVALTDDVVKDGLRAGDIIRPVAQIVGGGGGGRPNMAQAGGTDADKLPQALDKAREMIADS